MSGSDSITDGIIADSAGGELADAIRNSKRKKRNRESAFQSPTEDGVCSNCGTKLSGPVCHSCGQTADGYHRPIWELFAEVFDGLFGVEGRLWRTVPPLMFQPGKLTRQYLSGVRARYVLPFRLYLTASILFFIVFGAMTSFENIGEPGDVVDAEAVQEQMDDAADAMDQGLANIPGLSDEERAAAVEAMRDQGVNLSELDALNEDPAVREARQNAWREETKLEIRRALLPEDYPEDADTTDGEDAVVDMEDGVTVSVSDDVGDLPYWIRERLAEQAGKIIDDNGAAMIEEMFEWAPRLMFLLLPIYALLLAVTHFYKRGYYLYDHLVVSLHFHAYIFFLFVLLFALAPVLSGWGVLIFLVWSNYYLYRIHRVVYSHGRFSSLLRTIFMDFVYLIILMFGMFALLIIGAWNA